MSPEGRPAADAPLVFRARSPLHQWIPLFLPMAGPLFFLALALRGDGPLNPAFIALGVLSALCFLDALVGKVELTVGLDGIRTKRFGLLRFFPYAEIKAVERLERDGAGATTAGKSTKAWRVYTGVRFYLRAGGSFDVGTGMQETPLGGAHSLGSLGTYGTPDEMGKAIVRVVRERIRALAERHTEAPLLEKRLVRDGRGVDAWLTDLRGLRGAGKSAYREAAPDKETLLRLVEDPAAAPTARAGAAVVVKGSLEPSDTARVRVALAQCASPRLRVALEIALTEDEEEAAEREALSQVE